MFDKGRKARRQLAARGFDLAASSAVMPRFRRGIQYAGLPVCSRNIRRGVLDRPIKSGDDG
jgi:hypothetical protein